MACEGRHRIGVRRHFRVGCSQPKAVRSVRGADRNDPRGVSAKPIGAWSRQSRITRVGLRSQRAMRLEANSLFWPPSRPEQGHQLPWRYVSWMDVTAIRGCPVPTWLLRIGRDGIPNQSVRDLVELNRELLACEFRGVPAERLAQVWRTGIDVEPTDSPIFVDGLDKALEYGGWPKVVLALDGDHLDRTFREVSADLPDTECEALQEDFPTVLESSDGITRWYSRLPKDDPRTGSAYEVAYSRWIRGDPLEALRGVIVLAYTDEDVDGLLRLE
jgi:hypothetical protein